MSNESRERGQEYAREARDLEIIPDDWQDELLELVEFRNQLEADGLDTSYVDGFLSMWD